MKCPHCKYIYGWDNESMDTVENERIGDFWTLPIKLEREEGFNTTTKQLYACPACGTVFVEI